MDNRINNNSYGPVHNNGYDMNNNVYNSSPGTGSGIADTNSKAYKKAVIYNSMDQLSDLRSRASAGVILGVTGFLVFLFANIFFQSGKGIFFGFLLIAIGIFYSWGVSKKYKAVYKQLFVEDALNRHFSNVFYSWKSGFTKERVKTFGLNMLGNKYSSEDYLRATLDGVDFEMSDVTIQDVRSTGKSTYTVTYFKGRMMVFDFPDKNVNSVQVFTDTYKYRGKPFGNIKPQKVEMEGVAFNKKFDVFSLSPHDAFYLLTPNFMEKLDRLASRYPSIALHISMNKIYIGFNEPTNNAFDTKSMLTNISYDQEVKKIEKDINDIKYIISMIRELHANSGNVPQGAPADNTINQSGFGYMDPEYDSNNYYQSL